MSLEKKIVSCCIKSRAAFDKIEEYLGGKISLPISELIIDASREYYARDGTADSVDIDWLVEKIRATFDSEKKADAYVDFVKEIQAINVSIPNVTDLILSARRKEVGHKLAASIVNEDGKQEELIEEYQSLSVASEQAEEDDVLHNVSISESVDTVLNRSNLIKLPTKALNEATDGGALPGHHILVYARPETGKTALCISFLRAFAYQELPGIYFGNEDPIRSIVLRAQCCLTGMSKDEIREHPAEAQALLNKSNFSAIRFIPLNPGSPQEITKYVKRYGAKWVMVDQGRNINVKSDTRVNQLEGVATFMRNLAIGNDLVSITVTQAGDSAENKLVLGMGDIDFSNTGMPAQADLMIGMGVNPEYEQQGLRMISLPKNKLSGKHVHFPVRLDPTLSRVEDI